MNSEIREQGKKYREGGKNRPALWVSIWNRTSMPFLLYIYFSNCFLMQDMKRIGQF